MGSQQTTVVIVDDEPALRTLIRHVLEESGFQIVGEAENGAEAIELVRALKPDVVTMDLEMPVLDGASAVAEICKNGICPPVVIVSGSASSAHIGAALVGGARWHVAKRDIVANLAGVLLAIVAG